MPATLSGFFARTAGPGNPALTIRFPFASIKGRPVRRGLTSAADACGTLPGTVLTRDHLGSNPQPTDYQIDNPDGRHSYR
jgi:hypothetical protein